MPFPGGSKARVDRAGQAVRDGNASDQDYRAIDDWRAAHRNVLNTFQSILRGRTRTLPITVAQRHKRRNTILEKLERYPRMRLSQMDDVAGCRLIFQSIKTLHEFRDNFLNAKFDHSIRNSKGKYDYIAKPKQTGYRGIHDVYSYDVNSAVGRELTGLLVEIQYRTLLQHSWATAVEVIAYVSESQPKFEKGDTRYRDAMAFASELLARHFEDMTGPLPELSSQQVVSEFDKLDRELKLRQRLSNLQSIDSVITTKKNTILLISSGGALEVKSYRHATTAIQTLFDLEEERPDSDVVLVRGDSTDDIRLAFKNYFSDATDFISLINDAVNALRPKRQRATGR
ncbi:RelA/SpoT domain protein [Rhodopirellula islandica]|uniref:RelA/SpoT domain protein n=1 Tax=Rhodopirellula islandica TaxID=595434 RepID=A0A0J1BEI1_RHOIS|nr:RelA/SpoT domain-containing protein [Rhodopirellula islandica]KLU04935.1 RelA/SpoT domain protein [Rhodopirellula islandica]